MKKLTGVLVVICGCFLPLLCRGAETNHARLFCLSVQFGQGLDNFGDTMDFSSVDPMSLINGELAPNPGTYSHGCYFLFDDGSGLGGVPGVLLLNTPAGQDANSNGFNDFFESSQAVSATTS